MHGKYRRFHANLLDLKGKQHWPKWDELVMEYDTIMQQRFDCRFTNRYWGNPYQSSTLVIRDIILHLTLVININSFQNISPVVFNRLKVHVGQWELIR